MAKVRETTRVHPKTISATKSTKRRRRPTPKVKDEVKHSVTTTKVDLLVWAKALELAGGDRSRIEVIDPTTVRVKNPGQ